MLGPGGGSAGSYLTDPTSPHPLALCCDYPVSKCLSASIVVTSTVRVKMLQTQYDSKTQFGAKSRFTGCISSLLCGLPKLPGPFKLYSLGNLGNLGNSKEIYFLSADVHCLSKRFHCDCTRRIHRLTAGWGKW